eukprot:UN28100
MTEKSSGLYFRDAPHLQPSKCYVGQIWNFLLPKCCVSVSFEETRTSKNRTRADLKYDSVTALSSSNSKFSFSTMVPSFPVSLKFSFIVALKCSFELELPCFENDLIFGAQNQVRCL